MNNWSDMNVLTVRINELSTDPNNARKHNKKNIDAIKGSLRKFGQQKPIVIDRSNIVVAGNGTLEAAVQLGWAEIKAVVTDLSDFNKMAFALADNKTAELAEWDEEIVSQQLAMLDLQDFDVSDIGFDFDMPGDDTKGLTDPNEVPEITQNVFGIKVGDVWQLGNHRLMCGDSTSKNNVSKLMDGQKADMVFTDPPYGVSYTKKTKEVFKSEEYTEIKNDEKSGDDLKLFFKDVFTNIIKFLTDTCSYYVCSPQGGDSEMMMMMMRESGMKCRHQIIWVKDAPVFSMGRLDYDYKHEPILYGWLKKHEFQRKGSQDKSVWEFKRTENKLHPTMKPVELIENAILNSTKSSHLVSDFFLGSGSTLIACEKTGRTCYGMELDEHYCSIIIKRWQDFTGKQAERIVCG
jgi:DNA modification methylase